MSITKKNIADHKTMYGRIIQRSNIPAKDKKVLTSIDRGFDATYQCLVDIIAGMSPLMAATTPLDDLLDVAFTPKRPTLTGEATHPRDTDPNGWQARLDSRAAHVATLDLPTPSKGLSTKNGIFQKKNEGTSDEGKDHPDMVAWEESVFDLENMLPSLFANDTQLGFTE